MGTKNGPKADPKAKPTKPTWGVPLSEQDVSAIRKADSITLSAVTTDGGLVFSMRATKTTSNENDPFGSSADRHRDITTGGKCNALQTPISLDAPKGLALTTATRSIKEGDKLALMFKEVAGDAGMIQASLVISRTRKVGDRFSEFVLAIGSRS